MYVALGANSTALWSENGTTGWSAGTTPAGTSWEFRDVVYAPALRKFVAVGSQNGAFDGNGFVAESVDGKAWALTATPPVFSGKPINAIAWSEALSLFVAVGQGGALATSPDAATWTARTVATDTRHLTSVEWSPDLGLFVVGATGSPYSTFQHSANGTSWTLVASNLFGGQPEISGIAWSPSLALFAAATTSSHARSANGQSWSYATSPDDYTTGGGRGAVWTGAAFLSPAFDSTLSQSNRATRSTNGTSWGMVTTPAMSSDRWRGIGYHDGVAILVGDSGRLATSDANGQTWTLRTSGTTRRLLAVTGATLNRPPNAPLVSDQGPFDRAVTNRIPWTFSDPDPGDTQSAAELRYRIADTSTWLATVSIPNPNQFWDSPPGTWVQPRYEAQARTADQSGAWGPWSTSFFITAGDKPGAATWLDPINGQTISTSAHTGTISHPDVDEVEYRLYADDGGVMSDTQVQPAQHKVGADRRSVTWSGLVNGTVVWWWARIKHGGLWSDPAVARTPISYTGPANPIITAVTFVPDGGALDIAIVNPAPTGDQPTVDGNDVEIYDLHPGDTVETWKRIEALALTPPNATARWWLPRSGVDYTQRVRVTARGSNGTSATTTGVTP